MTILDEIVTYKRGLLEQGYYEDKLTTLENVDVSHKKTFQSQLDNSNKLGVIAEIKSKSPTLDALPGRDLAQQVKDYEAHGANAVSILTDEHYFGGSYERSEEHTSELQSRFDLVC